MSDHDDILNEIERFDDDYEASQGFRQGLDSLEDGVYRFTIIDAELARTQEKKDPILRLVLRVQGKHEVERVYFLTKQQGIDRLGGDLMRLEIDADQWTAGNGRPFSKELAKALPRLQGLSFTGKKRTKDEFHNLDILSLVNGQSDEAAPKGSTQGAMFSGGKAHTDKDEIPF